MVTSQVETVSPALDKVKLALAVALVPVAVSAFYLLGRYGPVAQWSGLGVGLVAATLAFVMAEPGKAFIGFGRDAWREVKKVVWPSRKEAVQMTAYVFVFVLLMALFLWLADKTLEWLLYDLVLGWKK